ncbi:MAG: filamentous hemagglutinin N-terminal domain-containing protein [Xenococcaceae cyanobacterium]
MTKIILDNSLSTNFQIEIRNNIQSIPEGNTSGKNLFYSFEFFSVSTGETVHFTNNPAIEHIFVRITGKSASNIDGIIKAEGAANLFLFDPNGIVFGKNARLNIGGSFVGSTANSLEFADGNRFSAKNLNTKPMTASYPIELGFLENEGGAISINGKSGQIIPSFSFSPTKVSHSPKGLFVPPGKTLALIGNEIDINEGNLATEDGQIYLAGVGSGFVSLKKTERGMVFGFDRAIADRDIAIDRLSLLDASGEGEGTISLTGGNVTISDGSLLLIQNTGNVRSGYLNINATECLSLLGTSLDGNVSSAIRSETLGTGDGVNINIRTKKLLLRDGGRIGTTTYSDASGGTLTIEATESVRLLENTAVNPERQSYLTSSIAAGTYGNGDAGSLHLSTSELKVTDGGIIVSSTVGNGSGGDITIDADSIEVTGLKPQRTTFSSISASSVGAGNAGTVTVNTSRLRLTDGATFSSSSFATGDAGSLTINASESIEISGRQKNVPSRIRTSVSTTDSNVAQNRLGLPETKSGNAGNITIDTPVLKIDSGGIISVSNEGTGNAGNLKINAESISLDDRSRIDADAAKGKAGTIQIKSRNLSPSARNQITARSEFGINGSIAF